MRRAKETDRFRIRRLAALRRARLARESAKLDPIEEQALAEERYVGEVGVAEVLNDRLSRARERVGCSDD
ncbi:MAG TPA: hypothetical protein VJ276_17280 [Thermoanaerobaculia bacterium]|nr:hypothetical protein [Thermoanaerobaculia bacterium]